MEEYPSINTAGSIPALVSTADGAYLMAIGGYVHHWSPEVKLFQVKSRRWYRLTDLPQPLPFPSATICGDVVHGIGDGANGYSCSLQALPSSDTPIPPQSVNSFIHWTPLPPLPVTRSTAATLCGQLILVGGWQNGSLVNSIHQLVDGQWVEIGSMTRARSECLVVCPSLDKIMIVGGFGAQGKIHDSVEECVVVA